MSVTVTLWSTATNTNGATTVSTPVNSAPSAILPGDWILVAVSADNPNQFNLNFPTIADSKGNQYTEFINQGANSTTANGGVGFTAWYAVATQQLAITDQITVTFPTNRPIPNAKAVQVWRIRPSDGLELVAWNSNAINSNSSVVLNVPSNGLAFGFVGAKDNGANIVEEDTDTTGGAWSTVVTTVASTGTASTSQMLAAQWKVPSAAGNQDKSNGTGTVWRLAPLIVFHETISASIAETFSLSDSSGAIRFPITDAKLRASIGSFAIGSLAVAGLATAGTIYSDTQSESLVLNESLSGALTVTASRSEPVNSSDSVTNTVTLVVSRQESITSGHTFSSTTVFNSSHTEQTSVADSFAPSAVNYISLEESTLLNEAVSSVFIVAASISDAIGAADSYSPSQSFFSSVIESVNSVDQQDSILIAVGSLSEGSLGLGDQLLNATTLVITQTETTGVNATAGSALTLPGSLAENTFLADARDQVMVSQNAMTVSATVDTGLGSIASYVNNLSELVSLLENSFGGSIYLDDLLEGFSLVDARSAQVLWGPTVSENVLTNALQSNTATLLNVLGEAISAGDSSLTTATFQSALLASVALLETSSGGSIYIKELLETFGSQDSTSASLTLPVTRQELLSLAENLSTSAQFLNALQSPLTTTDSVVPSVGISTNRSESMSLAQGVSATLGAVAGLSESLVPSEQCASILNALAALNEQAVVQDSFNALINLNSAITEAIGANDDTEASRILTTALAESAVTQDAFLSSYLLAASFSENAGLLESNDISIGASAAIYEGVSLADLQSASRILAQLFLNTNAMIKHGQSAMTGGLINKPMTVVSDAVMRHKD